MTDLCLSPAWIEQLKKPNRLLLGLSGGLDSMVLLDLLARVPVLRPKILAVHVHHGLSPHADKWQDLCALRCSQLGVAFVAQAVNTKGEPLSEAKARKLRFGCFEALMKEQDALLLAHHEQDQAETLLLKLLRGAGIEGLCAMSPSTLFGKAPLFRPLLTEDRSVLLHYAQTQHLRFIEDESNDSLHYARNFLRLKILPLLKRRWPKSISSLTRTALHCQNTSLLLKDLALIDCPELATAGQHLNISKIIELSEQRIINVLRCWLKAQGILLPSAQTHWRLLKELVQAAPDAQPEVAWGQVIVRRYKKTLYLDAPCTAPPKNPIPWPNFPNKITLPAHKLELSVHGDLKGLSTLKIKKVDIRFRQGGELINLNGQSKAVKKLFQAWGIPPWRRPQIPLIYCDDTLLAVADYAQVAMFQIKTKHLKT